MKAITRLTVAALTIAALGAAAMHAIDAKGVVPASVRHETGATDAAVSKSYADWQGAFTRSFGARVLEQGAPWDTGAGGTSGHGLALHAFDGLDKMRVWHGGSDQAL